MIEEQSAENILGTISRKQGSLERWERKLDEVMLEFNDAEFDFKEVEVQYNEIAEKLQEYNRNTQPKELKEQLKAIEPRYLDLRAPYRTWLRRKERMEAKLEGMRKEIKYLQRQYKVALDKQIEDKKKEIQSKQMIATFNVTEMVVEGLTGTAEWTEEDHTLQADEICIDYTANPSMLQVSRFNRDIKNMTNEIAFLKRKLKGHLSEQERTYTEGELKRTERSMYLRTTHVNPENPKERIPFKPKVKDDQINAKYLLFTLVSIERCFTFGNYLDIQKENLKEVRLSNGHIYIIAKRPEKEHKRIAILSSICLQLNVDYDAAQWHEDKTVPKGLILWKRGEHMVRYRIPQEVHAKILKLDTDKETETE